MSDPSGQTPFKRQKPSRPGQFTLRNLFALQAVVALGLSYAIYLGWRGVVPAICGAVVGTLLGSCYENLKSGVSTRFFPRKWETRGAMGGAFMGCSAALFLPGDYALYLSLAIFPTLLLYLLVNLVVVLVTLIGKWRTPRK